MDNYAENFIEGSSLDSDFVVSNFKKTNLSLIQSGANDDHSDTQSGATIINAGETLSGVINDNYDVDYFAITLTAGETIEIIVDNHAVVGYVTATSGFQTHTFSAFEPLSYTADGTGTHFISFEGPGPAAYTISVAATEPDIPGNTSTTEVLSLDGSVSSISNGNRDEDWFVFEAIAGQEVLFELDTDNFHSNLLIYNSAGQQVGGNSGFFDHSLAFLFETTDTYYVAATLGGDNGTPFSLSASTLVDDFSDSINTTGEVSLATDASGVIEFERDSDWFEFSASAGQLLEFTIFPSDESLSLGIQFFDSTGTELTISELPITHDGGFANESGALTYHLDIETSGTYYVSVEGGSSTGSYDLGLDLRSFPDVAGNETTTANLTIGTPFIGDIFADNDADYIRVNLTAGETYIFTEYFASGGTNILNFVGPTGATTDFHNGSEADQYLITPAESGTYYLALVNSGLPHDTTDLTYRIESEIVTDDHGDSSTEATLVNPYEGFGGVIEVSDDTDWFSFTLGQDEDILFTNNDNVLFYNFYDSSGNIVGNTSFGVLADVDAGTYFVEVQSSFNRDEGLLNAVPYSLQAERIFDESPGDTSTNLTISEGQTRVGALSSDTDQDWYSIEVNAGDNITFNAVDRSGSPLSYTLYDSDGVDLGAIVSGVYEITFFVGGEFFVGVSQTSVAYAEYSLTWFESGTPTIVGSGFDDEIEGGGLSSDIFTLSGQDTIAAAGGDDTISTGFGRDIVIFSQGDGNDTVTDFNSLMDKISLELSSSTTLSQLQNLMSNSGEDVVITLEDGSTLRLEGIQISDLTIENFIFTGPDFSNGSDHYIGTDDNETLDALDGDDFVNGLGGDDVIDGGLGNDTLEGGAGDDVINGGAGIDYVLYNGVQANYTITANDNGSYSIVGEGTDTVTNVEFARFTDVDIDLTAEVIDGTAGHDNPLNGTSGNDVINALAGDDILIGGAGNDTLDGGDDTDTAIYIGSRAGFTLAETGSAVTVDDIFANGAGGDEGTDTLRNIEFIRFANVTYTAESAVANNVINGTAGADANIFATVGADIINGLDGDDSINASNSNDTIFGGAGDDSIIGGSGADLIDGGVGTDQARYANSNGAVTVNLATGETTGGHAQGDTLVNIEDLFGSNFNDTLTGDAGDNVLSGSNGNDTLTGAGGTNNLLGGNGDDTFIGGAGADFNNGGGGFGDTIDYSGSFAAVEARLGGSQVFDGGFATGDDFQGIEDLIGSAFDDALVGNVRANVLTGNAGDDFINGDRGTDTLLGGDGDDTLIGGLGRDTIDGGDGIDQARYANANSRAVVDLSTGEGSAGHSLGDTLISIENLFGSRFNDVFTGDAGDNVLDGWIGVDRLNGGAGDDTLIGGAGNDRFIFSDNWDDDTIADFEDGGDLLDFRTVTGVDALSDLMVTNNASGDAVISFGGDSVTLTGIDAADIDAGDFLF